MLANPNIHKSREPIKVVKLVNPLSFLELLCFLDKKAIDKVKYNWHYWGHLGTVGLIAAEDHSSNHYQTYENLFEI